MATVQEKIDRFHEKLAKIEMGGGQDKIDKQHEKGKQTARERLNKLFDALRSKAVLWVKCTLIKYVRCRKWL